MSVEKNKTLARTLTEEVWNKGNLDIVAIYYPPTTCFTIPEVRIYVAPRNTNKWLKRFAMLSLIFILPLMT